MKWGSWLKVSNDRRRAGLDVVNEKYRVSTIFLGLDHNFGLQVLHLSGKMMIFPLDLFGDLYCDRYTSYEDAVSGHQKAIDLIKSGKFNKETE